MFLDISGNVDGVVWPMHYADIRLKHPEKKFKPGQVVKARVSCASLLPMCIVNRTHGTLLRSDFLCRPYQEQSSPHPQEATYFF